MYKKSTIKFLGILLFAMCIFQINAQVEMPKDSIKTTKDTLTVDSLATDIGSGNEIKTPITYASKDSMMFSVKSKKIFAYGEGKLAMDDMNLEAGMILMDMDSSYLFAKAMTDAEGKEVGTPVYNQGSEKYEIRTIKYNTKTKKAIVSDIVTEMGGGFMQAKTTKMMPNGEINLGDGKYSTCDAKHPHFYIQLTKAKVIPDQAIISGPFYFVISDIRLYPIGLPFGYFPSQKNRSSGIILPSYGEEKRRGFYLQRGGYYLALGDYVDLTMLGDIYTSGSWGVNVSSIYKKRYKYNGRMNFSYNKVIDGDKDLKQYTGGYTNSTNFALGLNYSRDSKAMQNASFSFNVNLQSSNYRKYNIANANNVNNPGSFGNNNASTSLGGVNTPGNFADNNTSSSISYTKDWPRTPFHFSANMSANQNLSDTIINFSSLPTIALTMNTQHPFKGKNSSGKTNWYREISVGFSTNMQNTLPTIKSYDLITEKAKRQMKNGLEYRIPISTSMKLLSYLNLSPSFSYNGRVYSDYLNKRLLTDTTIIYGKKIPPGTVYTDTLPGINHLYDFSFSVPLSTKLYGIKNFSRGKIAAIRHVISPSVSFSYTPDFAAENWNYYEYDPLYPKDSTDSYNKRYSKYSNGIYGSPPSGKNGSVGFSLGNNFEMKTHTGDTAEPEKKIVLLNALNFSTSYNIAAKDFKWAPINISADTKLFKQVNVNYSGIVELYDVDTTGKLKNELYYKNDKGGIGWFKSNSFTLSGSVSSETFKKKKTEEGADNLAGKEKTDPLGEDDDKGLLNDDPLKKTDEKEKPDVGEYSFKIPWNLSINYSLNFSNNYDIKAKSFKTNTLQTLSLNGDLTLTQKWKLNGSMSYDFDKKIIVYTTMGISRDLHCWQMGFNFVPFGTFQSYNFRINVKSSMLQGLEYKKQQSYQDNL